MPICRRSKLPSDLKHELDDLRVSFFDATFEPMTIAKSPVGGKDTIQASSNTFYPGLSLADLKGFQEKYPLNSRVVKGADGKLTELVYRAGTPDGKVPPGVYATFLKRANDCFQKARAYAEPGASRSYRPSHPLLPDRRLRGVGSIRHRLGAERRHRRLRQRIHRGLSRRPRRQRKLAEFRHHHR